MGSGALDRLDRILYILPRGAAEGGVALDELARELEVPVETVIADIHEVLARAYYHPAATGSQVRAEITDDGRLQVETTGQFRSPTRLTPREALAVALALRMRLGADPARRIEDDRLRHLCARMEDLARTESEATSADPEMRLEPLDPRDRVEEVLLQAHRSGRCCRIRYLAAHDDDPDERTIRPYALAHGDGHWYTVARCEAARDIRVFRFDRVLHAELLEETFTVPDDFDGAAYTADGQVHDGRFSDEVEVVYRPSIARWVRERWEEGEEVDGGGYAVRHPVSDPRWVVGHVLHYGGEAVVRAPERYRAMVREGATEVVGAG